MSALSAMSAIMSNEEKLIIKAVKRYEREAARKKEKYEQLKLNPFEFDKYRLKRNEASRKCMSKKRALKKAESENKPKQLGETI